jgi:hypothetical protein
MIGGRLPDFGPIVERYAADLKVEAQRRWGPGSDPASA